MARRKRRVPGTVVAGPLAPFAEDYEAKLRTRGYSSRSVVCELRHLARLSRWMEERRLLAADMSKQRLEEFLGEVPRRRDGGRVCSRRALAQVLEVLDEHGVGRAWAEEAPASPSEALLSSFERFLLQERAVALSTASVYVARARRFLDWCAPDAELTSLRASEVTGAVLQGSASQSVSATKLFVTALRSFLRYSFIEGLTPSDLSAAALSVARRRRSSLPMGVDSRTATALLRSCDRRRAKGQRDYAVLLTLLRLGLRAGEVARLRLGTSTGEPARSWCAARGVTRTVSRCRATSVRRSLPTSRRGARTARCTARCSCGLLPRSGRSGRTGSRGSCAAPVCGRECRSSGRTGSAIRLHASWPTPAPPCPRSPRSSATAPSPLRLSTPAST